MINTIEFKSVLQVSSSICRKHKIMIVNLPKSVFPWFRVDHINFNLYLNDEDRITVYTDYLNRYFGLLHFPIVVNNSNDQSNSSEDSDNKCPQVIVIISLPGVIKLFNHIKWNPYYSDFWNWLISLETPDKDNNKLCCYPFDFEEIVKVVNKTDNLDDDSTTDENNITIFELADILTKNNYSIESDELLEDMYKCGFLKKYNNYGYYPFQNMIEKSYLGVQYDEVRDYGSYHIYVTPKGKDYFVHYYMDKFIEG